jgi:hypothetical protein
MNIEQAKAIPVARILEILNIQPARSTLQESRSMKDDVMIRAFEYIGLAIPTTIKGSGQLPVTLKTAIMYQLFLETHYPEFWEENRAKLAVFNHQTGQLINGSHEENSNPETPAMTDDQLRTAIEEKALRQVITSFYESVSLSRFEDAWEFISPNCRKRIWNDNPETFQTGFTNTISIHHVHVFDIVRHSSGIKCRVYYEDDVVTYTSIELGNISKIPLSDLENFSERVKRLIAQAANAGLDGFEKIELQKLFEPAFSEYVFYRCGLNFDKMTELLPSQETLTIPRLYTLSCVQIDNEWLINAINPVKAHSIR